MSDKEFGGEDLSLPKATVQKIINEVLYSPAMAGGSTTPPTFSKDTRDLLIECCVEFITMLSAEANEIAEREAKKTIACEHVTKALEDLGFGEYVPELKRVANDFKVTQAQGRERRVNRNAPNGMSNDELIRAQESLFKSASAKFNNNATSPGAQ
ncbi:putative CBF/NF-Y family transcription factor [Piedraia hortae CBS 480.64]|uniref:NCT transcriptional regulatory complex subunit B n=1 Tax=Piedraia hortae CBS 480.64 TaxID=1314780 RepID=A0A6A7C886_9PEZI|nr:putative CBF/NF-Y family transcription factor [Piedraia hortae CBS 480.64]